MCCVAVAVAVPVLSGLALAGSALVEALERMADGLDWMDLFDSAWHLKLRRSQARIRACSACLPACLLAFKRARRSVDGFMDWLIDGWID